MGKIIINVAGEEFENAIILPAGWYKVKVSKIPEFLSGKNSGKKYIKWELVVLSPENFSGSDLILRTTLDKGDNPKKSKRWLFHQCMVACEIEKIDEKYTFELSELLDKEFFVKVEIREENYNNRFYEKNKIKMVSLFPLKSDDDKNENLQEGIPF